MRVIYAAQLLSNSVSRLMIARGGEEMTRSAWIAGLFNKWFDCMNTTLRSSYNSDLKPYESANDERLLWLEKIFLGELKQWEDSITGVTKSEREKKFLSHQRTLA